MIVLLAPAKRLDESAFENRLNLKSTTPWFSKSSKQLVNHLKKLDAIDLIEMMHVSANIAKLNTTRYQNFDQAKEKMAIFLFQGDSYRSLDPKSLNKEELIFAQKHLVILSGLYGMIRPLDLIKPYRLEMGTSLSFQVNEKNNLPDFWQSRVNEKINQLTNNVEKIINLASVEYSQVIQSNQQIIDIVFKQRRNGVFKTFGILAKKARGLMARYIIKNKITSTELLKKFNQDGYQFQKELSEQNRFVFFQES